MCELINSLVFVSTEGMLLALAQVNKLFESEVKEASQKQQLTVWISRDGRKQVDDSRKPVTEAHKNTG